MPDRRTLSRITLYVAGTSALLALVMLAIGGVASGLGALAGGALAVANWLALRWVGLRILVASDKGRAVWSALLALKMGALLAIVWAILSTGLVDPTGFTVGLSGLVLGALLGAFHSAASGDSAGAASEERG
ncbi:MAG: hypothetical protein M5U28_25645 [Sandaracinaceae bacterium]|nr:hypothetical protein [Sandaracinaceae bacterium]